MNLCRAFNITYTSGQHCCRHSCSNAHSGSCWQWQPQGNYMLICVPVFHTWCKTQKKQTAGTFSPPRSLTCCCLLCFIFWAKFIFSSRFYLSATSLTSIPTVLSPTWNLLTFVNPYIEATLITPYMRWWFSFSHCSIQKLQWKNTQEGLTIQLTAACINSFYAWMSIDQW